MFVEYTLLNEHYGHDRMILLIHVTLGVESLPDDMQRNISQMRELDLHYQGMM